uniref:Carbonic anhydrase n=1 Tax=Magallana gigas TaxID=29159 RepID=K1QML6_MAGGI
MSRVSGDCTICPTLNSSSLSQKNTCLLFCKMLEVFQMPFVLVHLNSLFRSQISNETKRTIVSKVRRQDGLLRPKQQPDNPLIFERSVQNRDLIWFGVWTLCFFEAVYLAKRWYARYTSNEKYIRARFPSFHESVSADLRPHDRCFIHILASEPSPIKRTAPAAESFPRRDWLVAMFSCSDAIGNKELVTVDQQSLLTLQKTTTKAQKNYKWSYGGQTGPDHWAKNFPQCGGKRQSPINIMTSRLHHVTWLPQFEFINYDKLSGDGMTPAFLHLRNNGHTASMTIDDDVYLRGSNLGELYRAVEIHFHWGPDNGVGSEHVIDNHRHPLEVHIVHYNTKYKTLSHAKQQPDGLAVIGVFADISEEKNHAFELIAMALDQVTEYNQRTIVTGIRPIDMLPNDTSMYYHYAGSLTTPPCYESVSWYIMHEGIKITQDQINRLRHLKEHVDEDHKPHGPLPPQRPAVEELKVNITHNNTIHAISNPDHHTNKANQYIRYNYRPSQPLYERKVYCSHPSMVKHTSYFPEFSVGDIAVNHHVSNLGDHDLSKALLQDTGSGFHHAIGSSLSSHPHDGHSSRSTLNIHSHGSDLPPQKVEIDFNGRNSKQQRITDALHGHPDEFLNKVLPKDLEDILTRNHIPNFEHNFDVLESETSLKTRKAIAAFVKSAPKVSDSPGFSTKRTSSVLLETLGLEKPAPFEETVNDGLSNFKTETAAERERTTQTTTNVYMTSFSTSPTTQSPEIVTSAIPPESYEPVRTTRRNEKVRFPIQRERNAPSIPIRSMLDGYKMLPMLTNPSPSKDQKPYLPL